MPSGEEDHFVFAFNFKKKSILAKGATCIYVTVLLSSPGCSFFLFYKICSCLGSLVWLKKKGGGYLVGSQFIDHHQGKQRET